jgi:glutaminyl-tRNA synthetase
MRDDLNETAERRIAVLDPLKLVIDNYPEGQEEECLAPNHPQQPELGKRAVPFSRELWIEREDFMEVPPRATSASSPATWRACATATSSNAPAATRMRDGNITAVHCEYLPDSKSGTPGADSYKVKGNLHWVSAAHAYRRSAALRPPVQGAVESRAKAAATTSRRPQPESKQVITRNSSRR